MVDLRVRSRAIKKAITMRGIPANETVGVASAGKIPLAKTSRIA